jgi:hypothetical protein
MNAGMLVTRRQLLALYEAWQKAGNKVPTKKLSFIGLKFPEGSDFYDVNIEYTEHKSPYGNRLYRVTFLNPCRQ